jgi:DNA modification methylase
VDTETPVYTSERTTLYSGDCLEILPTLERKSVDLLVTDPPYGIAFRSNQGQNFTHILGDENKSVGLAGVVAATSGVLKNFKHTYVFGFTPNELAEPCRLGGLAELIWDKGNIGMGDLSSPWGPGHESITFGMHIQSKANRERGSGNLSARMRKGSILRVNRPNSRAVNKHPTEKPVALMRELIESSSVPGDVVLDPFAGSGPTLIAAILLGRKAVGIELDAQYIPALVIRIKAAEALVAQMESL